MTADKNYTGGRFALTIGGQAAGFVKKLEIGAMEGDVFEHPNSADNVINKQLANFKWGDWSMEIALGMGDHLYKWLKAAIDKASVPQSGTVLIANFDYKAQREIQFFDACITEVSFPAFKASDKSSAYITIKFSPERVRWAKGDGSDIRALIGPKSKNYTTNNFRLELGSLPCKKVSEIGALKFESKVTKAHEGERNEPQNVYAKLTRPDLDVKYSAIDAKPWDDFAKAWFIDGKRQATDEMTCKIDWLAADMKTILASLTGQGVGFKKHTTAALEPNSENVNTANTVCYVENWMFEQPEKDL